MKFHLFYLSKITVCLLLQPNGVVGKGNATYDCSNGLVIQLKELCDRNNDCGNWDDGCDDRCPGQTDTLCRKYQCPNGNKTIRRKQFCDGIFDCPDFSDECLCNVRTDENNVTFRLCDQLLYQKLNECCIGYFRCEAQSTCIPGNRICDGIKHCTNGLDEANCPNSNSSSTNWTFRTISNSSFDDGVTKRGRLSHHNHPILRSCGVTDKSQTINYSSESSASGEVKGAYIDWRRRRDGVADCDGGFDEWLSKYIYCFNNWEYFDTRKETGCHGNDTSRSSGSKDTTRGRGLGKKCEHHLPRVLSSSRFMYASTSYPILLGILGIAIIIVNSVVVIHYIVSYCKRDRKKSSTASWSKTTNSILVFNLTALYSCSGVLIIAKATIAYASSGRYWEVSNWWMDKTICTFATFLFTALLGVITLTYAFLTGVRLFTILYPYKLVKLSCIYIILALCWILPICMTIYANLTGFKHFAHIPNLPQVNAIVLERDQVEEIVRRSWILYSLFNDFFPINIINLENHDTPSLMRHLEGFAPKFTQNWKTVGIYSSNPLCLPTPIVKIGEPGWEILVIMTIINMIIYALISAAYVVIFKKSTNRKFCCWKQTLTNAQADKTVSSLMSARIKEDRRLQRWIFWMIVLNILTWLPLFMVNVIYNLVPNSKIRTAFMEMFLITLLYLEGLLSPFFYSRFLRDLFNSVLFRPLKNLFAICKNVLLK